ncbi:sugar ABC transporter ATP-binding protein [Nocardioides flavescens]|uniref:ATP-binding cassette domain-containing protein n=1 Tax=Nocardioides flavescens TaxID=2691959 RepID=A0A6L7EY06_9ACTN|nr:sugar ABC transporter ATP-binding protein [Nocardioides flavescens]MXG89019.1 ATP-binding cassette domain-containing protein [Nocardioides flavescens]
MSEPTGTTEVGSHRAAPIVGAGRAPALTARGVTKTYTAAPVLLDAELQLSFGEVHALLGGNGSGKSTMIKILAGVVGADPGGTVEVAGGAEPTDLTRWSAAEARRHHLRFIHQDLGLVPDLTVAENLFIEASLHARRGLVSWSRLRRDAEDVLARFDLDLAPEALVSTLSLAEQTLLAAARALHDVEPGGRAIVVLDEPTAALPSGQADELMSAIRRYADEGHAILVVTHRLGEVVAVCDRITVLRQGRVAATGPLADRTEDDLGSLITGVDAATEQRTARATEPHAGGAHDGLRLQGVRTDTLEGIDLEVRPGEIVGLVDAGGLTGSRVLRTVFGLERLTGGTVSLGGRPLRLRNPGRAMAHGVAYLPGQRLREALFPGLSVGENVLLASLPAHRRGGLLSIRRQRSAAADAVRRFRVHPADATAEVTSLSGGNQQKVSVARWMVREPRCLLLEEPTQGVDIGARAEIWALIADAVDGGAAALVVSSDYQELATHCRRVVVYARGRHVTTLTGADLTVPAIAEVVHHA